MGCGRGVGGHKPNNALASAAKLKRPHLCSPEGPVFTESLRHMYEQNNMYVNMDIYFRALGLFICVANNKC